MLCGVVWSGVAWPGVARPSHLKPSCCVHSMTFSCISANLRHGKEEEEE